MNRSPVPLMALAAGFLAGTVLSGELGAAELVIESWRNDDLPVWQETIIPAFEAKHPDIKVRFQPTAPREYDAALRAKLDGPFEHKLLHTIRGMGYVLERRSV